MLRDEAISLLALRLGNRSDLNDVILRELQVAQGTVCEGGDFKPWFLLTENATASTAADEERVVVPDDFLREYEEGALWLKDPDEDEWSELKKYDLDVLSQHYKGTGRPVSYDIVGMNFVLKPTPDKVYRVRMKYYAVDEALTENIENKWLKYAADWLIAEAGVIVAATHLQDDAMAARFAAAAKRAQYRVYVEHEARQHTNRSYARGDL